MTNEELSAMLVRIDEIRLELDVILGKISDHNTETEVLWERYWKLFDELVNLGKTEEVE